MKKQNNRQFAWLLLFGSLWGISEVAMGGVLYNKNVPYASVWISAWAFFVLALARGIMNKPGSSTVIAALAAIVTVPLGYWVGVNSMTCVQRRPRRIFSSEVDLLTIMKPRQ